MSLAPKLAATVLGATMLSTLLATPASAEDLTPPNPTVMRDNVNDLVRYLVDEVAGPCWEAGVWLPPQTFPNEPYVYVCIPLVTP